MKNRMKLIVAASACCLATAVSGMFAQNDLKIASAELTDVNTVAGHFEMVDGAEVRLAKEASGIRFRTTVSREWYQLATANGATVEFFTQVNKYNNEDEDEWSAPIPAKEIVDFSDEATVEYQFTGAIVYNNLDAQYLTAAYNLQLEARAYAVISKEGEAPVTVYAGTADTVRSIAEVADGLVRTGQTTALEDWEQETLEDYRSLTKANNVYIDKEDGTFDVATAIENANVLKVVMGDENDIYADDVYNFDDTITTAASDSSAIIYTDLGIIETNFKVCTKVIKSASDWENALDKAEITTGYYYLANDITGYPTLSMDTRTNSSTSAFKGVFDGGGHTASFSLTSHNGLFVYLNGATIKNVRFDIRMATQNVRNVGLAFTDYGGSMYADLYVNVEYLGSKCTNFAGLVYRLHGFSSFVRTVVETPAATELANYTQTSMGALFYAIVDINLTTGQTSNANQASKFLSDVYVISPLPLARQAGYAGAVNWTIYAQNKMTDTNDDKSITTEDIVYDATDSTKNVTYWTTTTNSTGYKVWSFDDFAEMKTATDAETIDPSIYTKSSFWKINEESGYLEWKGGN